MDELETTLDGCLIAHREDSRSTVDHHGGNYSYPIVAEERPSSCQDHPQRPCGDWKAGAARDYAWKYRDKPNYHYPEYGDHDCTNFGSQILRAGHMVKMHNHRLDYGNWAWWSERVDPGNGMASNAWKIAPDLLQHLDWVRVGKIVARGHWEPGDLMFTSFKGDGGKITHVSFIYNVRKGEPYLLQHDTAYSYAHSLDAFLRKSRVHNHNVTDMIFFRPRKTHGQG